MRIVAIVDGVYPINDWCCGSRKLFVMGQRVPNLSSFALSRVRKALIFKP
jgi:hypothetical protein